MAEIPLRRELRPADCPHRHRSEHRQHGPARRPPPRPAHAQPRRRDDRHPDHPQPAQPGHRPGNRRRHTEQRQHEEVRARQCHPARRQRQQPAPPTATSRPRNHRSGHRRGLPARGIKAPNSPDTRSGRPDLNRRPLSDRPSLLRTARSWQDGDGQESRSRLSRNRSSSVSASPPTGCTTHPAPSARLTLGRSVEEALQLSGQPTEPSVIRLAGHNALVHHDSSSPASTPVDA
jgi:hypothetical protein